MDIWYARLTEQDIMDSHARDDQGLAHEAGGERWPRRTRRVPRRRPPKAHASDSLQALSKLAEVVDGRYRIVSQPPLVIPARDLEADVRLLHDRSSKT